MDIFSSDKAPYAFILMVSVLGWFLTNAVSEGRKHLLLTYSSEVVTNGDAPYLRLTLRNDSVEAPFKNIAVELTCPNSQPCMTDERPATHNEIAARQMLPPWAIDLTPATEDKTVNKTLYSFSPMIPAGAELTMIAGLASPAVRPAVFLRVPDTTTLAPDLTEGFSFYGFVFRNYFSILLIGGAASILIFGGWIVLIASASATRPAAAPREQA